MKTDTPISVQLMHADPVVNIGLKALCDSLTGLNLCLDDDALSADPSQTVLIADYRCGLELQRQFSSDDVRVLIVTHFDKEGQIRQALRAGVRGYVLQSCVLQELEPALLAMSCGRTYISSRADRAIANSWYRADLTGRETDVLQLLGKGHCNKLIARELGLAEETVKTHLKNVMSKLNVSARVQAVVVANERGLLAN